MPESDKKPAMLPTDELKNRLEQLDNIKIQLGQAISSEELRQINDEKQRLQKALKPEIIG
jgi:hypothetical protein